MSCDVLRIDLDSYEVVYVTFNNPNPSAEEKIAKLNDVCIRRGLSHFYFLKETVDEKRVG